MTGILTLANDAADELSLRPVPSLFDESSTARKLKRALTKTCQHLAGRYDWQAIRREHVFTTIAGEPQDRSTSYPTDFLRFVMDTAWDRTNTRKIVGPLSPQQWQQREAWGAPIAVSPLMIERENTLYLSPTPITGGVEIAYEYISNSVGRGVQGGTWRHDGTTGTPVTPVTARLQRFVTDTDETFWDDELITAGIIANYRQAEGLDWAGSVDHFERMIGDRIKRDGSRRMLDMGGGRRCGHGTFPGLKHNVVIGTVESGWSGEAW